jgi:hypothetical protein
MSQSDKTARGQGQTLLLTDPHRLQSDIKMIGRAVAEEWDIPERATIIERLMEVVRKRSVEVMSKEGPIALEGPADANAIAASRVLAAMVGQNQAERHKLMDKVIPDASNQTQIPLQDAISHPKYLEYLEAAHMAGDSHTGVVGNVGQSGQVEAGQASAPAKQGTD